MSVPLAIQSTDSIIVCGIVLHSAVIARTVLHAGELCLTSETAFRSGPAGFESADLSRVQLLSFWEA